MISSHIYKAHGIVLKRWNVGEADRIVTLFTKEYGKIRVIAKGVRRIPSHRAPHLEVFRFIFATLHKGKTLDSVTEIESGPLIDTATHHIQKVSFAYYVCELVDRLLPERQEHADVFGRMHDALMAINIANDICHWQQIVCAFALELLWTLGYLPRATKLSEANIQPYVESIIERKLRTPKLLHQLG